MTVDEALASPIVLTPHGPMKDFNAFQALASEVERLRGLLREAARALSNGKHSGPTHERIHWMRLSLSVEIERLEAALAALTIERDTLLNGRVPCKSCGGKDDAKVENAMCYSCRQRPYQRIEELEAALAALRQRHAEAVEECWYEAWATSRRLRENPFVGNEVVGKGAAWLSSEARKAVEP